MTTEVTNALYVETKVLEKTVNFTDYVKLIEQNCYTLLKKLIFD